MTRAVQFGRRLVKLHGGASYSIFLVRKQVSSAADYSRGVAGTYVQEEIELIPRPIKRDVNNELITRDGSILRAGDIEIDIVGDQLTPEDLENRETRLRIKSQAEGGELLEIVQANSIDIGRQRMYWRLFCRGVTSH